MTCWPKSHAQAHRVNLPIFRWIQLFCWLTTWKKLFSQYREDGFEKDVTDARLLANECDASTEFAQKRNRKRKKNSRWSERWTTRAPERSTSFQTNGVLCNCWHHKQWIQHKIWKSGTDFREISFHFANEWNVKKGFRRIRRCYAASRDVSNDLIQGICSASGLLCAKPQLKNLNSFFWETLIHYSRIWLLH